MEIIGRTDEVAILKGLYEQRESSFLAVYGRRRIGKTYLIRNVYEQHIIFECSGLHQKDKNQQLENFWLMLQETKLKGQVEVPPKTWLQAFFQLRAYLNTLPIDSQKKVIFLDEISWFETPKSGFLAALDAFWNQYCTKRPDIILIICGSAASWIIEKVVNNRGGLHNRITHRVQLKPFTLQETKDFLAYNQVRLSLKDIAQIYMCVGGIPFYLKDIKAGYSTPQILDQLFFGEQPTLRNEFQNLYEALFKNSALHIKVITALASKNKGLTRNEILVVVQLKSSKDISIVLEELTQCGFIKPMPQMGKLKSDYVYRLIDEYSSFYFKFLINSLSKNSWALICQTPAFKIWSGYAFENLCFKHTPQIKKALGINGIISNEYSWTLKGDTQQKGSQIDLVIDRADNCINLVEVKFYDTEFEITKAYEQQLRDKIHSFRTTTKTRKSVFLTMISVYGVRKNEHYLSVVTNQLTIEDLLG